MQGAWGDPRRMAPVQLEVVRHGEVIRSAQSGDPEHPEVTLDFTVEARDGFWIAARARAGDGTRAHTTPVYVDIAGERVARSDSARWCLRWLDHTERLVREHGCYAGDAHRDDVLGVIDAARAVYRDVEARGVSRGAGRG